VSWSQADYAAAFDAETGDASSLADQAIRILWYNEGQARLVRKKAAYVDLVWASGAREVFTTATFLQLDKIVWNEDTVPEAFRVWGDSLVIDEPTGASGSGGARVYYWAEFTPMAIATTATETTPTEDFACLYYALSRFYRRLASNRSIYTRYSTLLGQNAVSMADLQQEYERYYQDFIDSREDVEPKPSAYFYPTYAS
jgi:hypothetical protein